jgi:outer membrane usher protein
MASRKTNWRRLGVAACLSGSVASPSRADTSFAADEVVRTARDYSVEAFGSSTAVTVPIERDASIVPLAAGAAPVNPSISGAATGGTQDEAPTARPTPVLTPIQGPLTLDGVYLGDISGEVDMQGEGVVDAVALMDLLGPKVSPGVRDRLKAIIASQRRVSMADLRGEGFSIAFDPLSLTFVAELAVDARARRDVSFARNEVIDPKGFDQPAHFSAGANINLAQLYSHDEDRFAPLAGGIDMFANLGGFDGVTLTAGVDYDGSSQDQRWRRREIRLSKDLFQSAVRLTAGEFSPPVESFQGSQRFLGVSAARAYSTIRPFQNVRPSGRRQFILDRPALVVVEVNGVVVERLRLEAGPYSLSDFPFGQGANTVRLLVEEDSGQREIAVFDLFGGAGLLDPGVVDFGVSAGVLEEGGQLEYGSTLAATGFVRKGITDVLTLGANAQWADGRGQVGGLATWGSRLGLIQAGGAVSHNGDTGAQGYIVSLDYMREATLAREIDLRVVASAQATSKFFQTAFQNSAFNREQWRAAGQALVRYKAYSVSLGAAFVKGRRQEDRTDFSVSVGRTFQKFGINLAWQRGATSDGVEETRFGLTLTTRFGGRWSSAARYDSQNDFREIGISRSSSGRLNDLSGDIRFSEDRNNQTIAGDLRYINNRFDAEIVSNRLVSTTPGGTTRQESLWRLSTLIGYADGAFGIGRAAREGFIIASPHQTLKNAQVSLTDSSGYPVARSGWFGPALAGIDRGYGVRRYELEVDPLPPGYDLGSGVINTFPGYGNGYRVIVGSDASYTARGVLMSPEGPVALVGGVIIAADAPPDTPGKPFFTNRGGRFVADGMAPGRYRLVVRGETLGEFVIPANVEGIIDVGSINVSRPQP